MFSHHSEVDTEFAESGQRDFCDNDIELYLTRVANGQEVDNTRDLPFLRPTVNISQCGFRQKGELPAAGKGGAGLRKAGLGTGIDGY